MDLAGGNLDAEAIVKHEKPRQKGRRLEPSCS
jgi:hypothetical protein